MFVYIELHKLQPLNLQYIAFHVRGQIIIEIPEYNVPLDMNITNWPARIMLNYGLSSIWTPLDDDNLI